MLVLARVHRLLRRELRQANKTIRSHEAAYRRGYATISDHEFDQMAAAREKLKAQLRVVAAHAPELQEEDQSIVLLSLDNQRFEYWYSTLPVATPMIVQPKIDGCSLGLRYVDGELVHASKRCGSDVRDVALTVPTIPRRIQAAGVYEIHGELHTLDAADPQKSQKAAARALNHHVSNDGLVFTAYRLWEPLATKRLAWSSCGSLVSARQTAWFAHTRNRSSSFISVGLTVSFSALIPPTASW